MKKIDFEKEIKHLVNIDFSEFDYINNYTKSKIKCKIHNKSFSRNLKQIRKGILCDLCSNKVTSTDKFIQQSKKFWGNKWSYVKTEYKSSREKLKIKCKRHNNFFDVLPQKHLKGEKDCELCLIEKRKSEFLEKVKDNEYDYSNINYINNKTHINIKCKKHGMFSQRPDNHLFNSNGCPLCNKSKGESKIIEFLEKNNINYVFQNKFKGCKNSYQLRFDFYLPDFNTCIEYNGIQHYEEVEHFGGHKTLEYNKKRDNIKKKYCDDNKISLIIIRYDEDINSKLNFLII